MRRTILIDGDTVIFSASSSTETVIQWDEWNWTLHGNLGRAIDLLRNSIGRIVEALQPDEVIVALSDAKRFRPDVMPDYKANRATSRKPVTYEPLRDYVREVYRTYQKPYLEGDDVLGILATHPKVIEGEKIIVAIDKDLNTIPGPHYNYDKELEYEVSQVDADRFLMTQTLTGDTTDGYKGCPGIGPKKAEKLLDGLTTIEEMWPVVLQAYLDAGQTEEAALQNARVARILRHTDYDYQNDEVILWTPPSVPVVEV